MKSRYASRTWAFTGAMLLILNAGAYAQQPPATDPAINQPSLLPEDNTPPPSLSPDLAARQRKMLDESRQKQLVLDAQKLLTLANELKIAVDKSDKNTLSLTVVRKADEIEKLAHAIKEKMKGT